MTGWAHRFRTIDIKPDSVIVTRDGGGLRPGEKIARAITEVQDKVVVECDASHSRFIDVVRDGNIVYIVDRKTDPEGGGISGEGAVAAGEAYQVWSTLPGGGVGWDWVRAH